MSKKKSTLEEAPSSVPTSFYSWEGEVLLLRVLGTPSAKRDVIGKPKGDQLKISVTAAPEDGKATDHMVAFLAREFGVSQKSIEVVSGRTSIHKVLRITNPKKLVAGIERLSPNA